ncbi:MULTISPECIES: glucose-1-phosphate cytidylyltransferase [Mycobacterium]|nr:MULTISPECIES: glucose-1-phosphate cytidylyltransferase [Mycobacterium]BDE13775.1 glucose-1-phosphate cytidylyltransferase [Mycobacterium sp. 20KCMC460]GLB83024.1 glucose-1-phosphate cytidylyltransferase [Mycobacterium kiyosense]GLB88981.1 glucose-1-phosphate cytidylyltransferase [Mycobacterium kiyosense]GLB94414.1 glucose-1-phosphate cytidylyltransferase [Mycobacterium kiyosense]GLC00905.1 glucose-1-phosphate cytidylyltransferase [Mycobacterium kiyosense]
MKAVLLAGGLGTRMREETEFRPKPMVEVGGRPVLWHIMKILGHHGISEFVVCTGYKSEYIKGYFSNYGVSNLDFTITLGDQSSIKYHGSHDEFNWQVTVADTGLDTMTGGRIKRIRKYVGDETFLCTYGDGIADVDIPALIEFHRAHGKIATVTATQPMSRFGVIDLEQDGAVAKFREKPKTEDWINIGYFIFEPGVFDYLEGDETVLEDKPLLRLAEDRQIAAFPHHGFWQPMDTFRESQLLNNLWSGGNPPWKVWS